MMQALPKASKETLYQEGISVSLENQRQDNHIHHEMIIIPTVASYRLALGSIYTVKWVVTVAQQYVTIGTCQ